MLILASGYREAITSGAMAHVRIIPCNRPGRLVACPRNLMREQRVQVDMRARKDHIVRSVAGPVMIGAVVVGVAACGFNSATGSGEHRTGGAQTPEPGTAVTVTFSRAPSPGGFASAPAAHLGHARITAGHSGHVTVTTSDDGATVVIVPGQTITVVLSGQGMGKWNRPRLGGSALGVLRQVSASGGYPSSAPARAAFRAVRVGTEAILSATNARCLHARPPCAIAQRSWRVKVVVRTAR